MPKKKPMTTQAELTAALNILKKKIEKRERQIIRPFIPMILKAEKIGNLEQLYEACKLVVNGAGEAERKKVTAAVPVQEVNITEIVAEPQYSLEIFKKIKSYFQYLLFG